jgi:hypothetical protein
MSGTPLRELATCSDLGPLHRGHGEGDLISESLTHYLTVIVRLRHVPTIFSTTGPYRIAELKPTFTHPTLVTSSGAELLKEIGRLARYFTLRRFSNFSERVPR